MCFSNWFYNWFYAVLVALAARQIAHTMRCKMGGNDKDWTGLEWAGQDWIGQDWVGLDGSGSDWLGLNLIGLVRVAAEGAPPFCLHLSHRTLRLFHVWFPQNGSRWSLVCEANPTWVLEPTTQHAYAAAYSAFRFEGKDTSILSEYLL